MSSLKVFLAILSRMPWLKVSLSCAADSYISGFVAQVLNAQTACAVMRARLSWSRQPPPHQCVRKIASGAFGEVTSNVEGERLVGRTAFGGKRRFLTALFPLVSRWHEVVTMIFTGNVIHISVRTAMPNCLLQHEWVMTTGDWSQGTPSATGRSGSRTWCVFLRSKSINHSDYGFGITQP